MTRWHTDSPIRPLSATSALTPVASVGMFRADGPARVALSRARARSLDRLRKWAKKRAESAAAGAQDGPGDEPTSDAARSARADGED